MSVNKIDVEKKRAEEKKLLSVMIGIYCRGNHGGNDGNKKELCDFCKKLEEYALFRTEKCPFMEGSLLCKRTAGTDSCSHALCRTADDIFSPGTCIKAHTDDHKRKEEKEKCFINGSCRNFVIT